MIIIFYLFICAQANTGHILCLCDQTLSTKDTNSCWTDLHLLLFVYLLIATFWKNTFSLGLYVKMVKYYVSFPLGSVIKPFELTGDGVVHI